MIIKGTYRLSGVVGKDNRRHEDDFVGKDAQGRTGFEAAQAVQGPD